MPGPTPLAVSFRLSFLYTAHLFNHKQRNYLACVPSGDPSGYDAVGYVIPGGIGVSTLADPLFTAMAPFYVPANDSFNGWLLEELVSGAWIYRASGVTTVVPTGAGAEFIAGGWDTVGKDSLNKTIHAYWYEGNFRGVDKASSYSALNTAEKEVIDQYFAVGRAIVNTDPANWRKGRGDSHPVRWLSAVWDSNQKLRRLRRIA